MSAEKRYKTYLQAYDGEQAILGMDDLDVRLAASFGRYEKASGQPPRTSTSLELAIGLALPKPVVSETDREDLRKMLDDIFTEATAPGAHGVV